MKLDEKRFVIEQIRRRMFVGTMRETDMRRKRLDRLYEKVVEGYESHIEAREVPKVSERNKDLVVVMTGQLLLPQHAPTKAALNICRILIEKNGKQVVLINVADMNSAVGQVPLDDYAIGNYIDSFSKYNIMPYKGVVIPFIQLDKGMPNADGIQGLVDMLCEFKPYYMIMVGGGSVVMDICAEYVPTMLIPMVGGDTYTRAKYHLMPIHGCTIDEQKEEGNREKYGIPKDRFVGVIVGNRLAGEIKDDFIRMLEECAEKGLYVVFVGNYADGYRDMISKNKSLCENSVQIDFVSDIMALYDCCDLYINPRRRGGGISALDALYKGVPVVTLRSGDVYDNIGDDFAVEDDGYESMKAEIIRYMTDKEYYNKKAKLGMSIVESKVESTDEHYAKMFREMEKQISEGK